MEVRNGSVHLRWGSGTDIGRKRRTNQDALLATAPLFIVADGMGGHAAGEVAAQLTVEAFALLLDEPAIAVRDLVAAARRANDAILGDVFLRPERAGMGTTVTGFSVGVGPGGAYAAVLNVGDSRTYLWREGELQPLTVDHSVVQELIDAGEISEHEVPTHPQRHVVTRVLGSRGEVEVDTSAVPLYVGDRLLVCSDGLTSVVAPQQIEASLGQLATPEAIVQLLIDLALQAGAPDNVTAIVVDILDAPTGPAEPLDEADTLPGDRVSSLLPQGR